MAKRFLLLCTVGIIAFVRSAYAQSLSSSVSVQGTFDFKYRTTLGLYHRTEDHFRGTSRWFANMQGEYRPVPAISFFGGYTFLYNRLYSADNLRRYWQPRHRLFASVMPRWNWNGLNFNYRQMYQIVQWKDQEHRYQNAQRLRCRIYAEHSTGIAAMYPFAYYELFFDARDHLRLAKHQFTMGASFYMASVNKISLQYRRIFRPDGKRPTDGLDVVGISYMFLFKIE